MSGVTCIVPNSKAIGSILYTVRSYELRSKHRTALCYKKNRSNGNQTTANGLATITAIFYDPQYAFENIFKNL